MQPLESGTLSLSLSYLIPSVVTSRPTTASRPSNPLNPSPLAPQIQLLLTTVRVYKLYVLTYLFTYYSSWRVTSVDDLSRDLDRGVSARTELTRWLGRSSWFMTLRAGSAVFKLAPSATAAAALIVG